MKLPTNSAIGITVPPALITPATAAETSASPANPPPVSASAREKKARKKATTRSRRKSKKTNARAKAPMQCPSGGASKKRVRIGDALREGGLDERMLASKYVGVVKKLESKKSKSDSVEKLLVDVLKECSRHLVSDEDADSDAPVIVQLVHNVPRPQR